MSVESSETLDSIQIRPFTCFLHGTDIEFGLYDRLWDDGSYLLFGYNSKNSPKITIAKQLVDLHVEIIPEDMPKRTNPFLTSLKKGQNTVTWYENALATLSAAFAFLQEFEEKRAFLLNGTLNSEIEKYYDHQNLTEQLDLFSRTLKNRELRFSEKIEQLSPVFISIRRILENCHIPDELKYEESHFFQNIAELQKHVQLLIEETGKTTENIIADFKFVAEHLADVLNSIYDDHQNFARNRKLSQTAEEKNAIEKARQELNRILTSKKTLDQAVPDIEHEIALCKNIWSNPAIDWQTRLNAATHAVDRISDAIDLAEKSAIESKKRYAIIPDLSRFKEEIKKQIEELDKTGFSAMTSPIADRFLSRINENRKSDTLQKITKQAFIDALKIDSLLVVATEKNGRISTALHLYLTSIHTQHYLYVLVLNNKISKMKLSGQKTPDIFV